MRGWALNGQRFIEANTVPLSDRGFRYGMAVFETLRVENGVAFWWEEHLSSLRTACEVSRFPIDGANLESARDVLRQARETGVARLHVTAGDGAPGDPARDCRVYLTFEPRSPVVSAAYRLKSSTAPHHPFAGGLKTHNYWPQTAALLAAREAGADEALLFDADGNLISAAMANVFVVDEDGTIRTPPADVGARAGILREWVCSRLAVQEATIDRESLRRAPEVFLTNSWIGVMPAGSVDDRSLPSQNIASRLRSDLRLYYDRSRE